MSEKRPKFFKYARPVKTYRPRRTRSKTGCLACRLRRKKCDEQKPICRGCEQQHLLCSWPNDVGSSDHTQGFAWRVKLKAGLRVSQCSAPSSQGGQLSSQHTTTSGPWGNQGQTHNLRNQVPIPQPPTAVSNGFLNSPCNSMLLEHYVRRTGPLLVGRDVSRNPFLYEVLPIAQSNQLVMHAVLAISGVHMQHANFSRHISEATYAHYGTALKQLKISLTDWVTGSREETLSLFLVTTLMCMYEAFVGNVNGTLSYHLRACREFATGMALTGQGGDLAVLLTETYVYFSLVAQFGRQSMGGACPSLSESDPVLSNLDHLRCYSTFGCFLGCASRLYELIPKILQLTSYPGSGLPARDDQNNDELYEELRTAITNWSPAPERDPASSELPWYIPEKTAGLIVQNTLFLLLYSSYLSQRWSSKETLAKIQPLIDRNMSLFEIITNTPAMHVTVWPHLITGSMMSNEKQRQHLTQKLLSHPTQTALGSRVVEILQWVWDDPDDSTFGIAGLEKVTRERGTYLCFV